MDKLKNLQPWQQVQGVYVHIPFCRQKCLYCDFNSYAGFGAEVMAKYAAAVCKEIAGCQKDMPVNDNASIYFGGGTPSLLPAEAIKEITDALKKYGWWQNPCEASIEANPGTVDLPKLKALRQLGFDRISFGVQSLNDAELKAIGRVHNAAEALEAIELAKQAGFKRINADVIYGLPGQTMASLKETLARLCSTGIEHLSVYGLIVEDGTPLQKLVDSGKIILPDEDEAADMYEFVQEFLKTLTMRAEKRTAAITLCTGIITRMRHLALVPAVLTAARVLLLQLKYKTTYSLYKAAGSFMIKKNCLCRCSLKNLCL